MTGWKVGFWRCPVRGLGIEFNQPPQTQMRHDAWQRSTLLAFSPHDDELAAKKDLVLNVVLSGIEEFRGLPNAIFRQQTDILRALMTAPASMSREDWLALRARVHIKTQPLLDTHLSTLQKNLLK
jgi:hypothetical protein